MVLRLLDWCEFKHHQNLQQETLSTCLVLVGPRKRTWMWIKWVISFCPSWAKVSLYTPLAQISHNIIICQQTNFVVVEILFFWDIFGENPSKTFSLQGVVGVEFWVYTYAPSREVVSSLHHIPMGTIHWKHYKVTLMYSGHSTPCSSIHSILCHTLTLKWK